MKIHHYIAVAALFLTSEIACTPVTLNKSETAFDHAVSIIENNYIDVNRKWVKLDTSKRPDIRSLIPQMDTRSLYLSSTEVKAQKSPRGTVGFQVRYINNEYRVMDVLDRNAAYKGLLPGDVILEVDYEPVADLSYQELGKKLSGAPGSEVMLKIRTPYGEVKDLAITRTQQQYVSYVSFQMIGNGIGYLRIARFGDETPDQVKEVIRRALDTDKMQALVIDIRANQGGLVYSILKTAELFLNKDDTIARIITGGNVERTYRVQESSDFPAFPIVVLADENTHAGAESFTAALKDNKRAMVAGERTGGTGAIKTIYTLKDRSQLIITTSYMQTPSRRPIHGRGIMPDRLSSLSDIQRQFLYERINSGRGIKAEIGNDPQLKAALEILSERTQKVN